MANSRISRLVILALMVALIPLTACGGRTPPAKFYTLQPVDQPSPEMVWPRGVALSVGPVAIPADIDRAEIVTRDDGNEVSFSEYHRWAGPIQNRIAEVMSQNIASLAETERVTPHNRENIFQATHRVVININRYDSQLSIGFDLDATWSIKDLRNRKILVIRNSIIRESLASSGYDGLVAAQSRALAALSRQIAAALADAVP